MSTITISAKPDSAGYYDIIAESDLKEGTLVTVLIKCEPIILVKFEDHIRAFSARCPHASGDLAKGEYYRGRIDCPEHEYRFDVRTGNVIWPEDELCRLRFFNVTTDGNRVKIRL